MAHVPADGAILLLSYLIKKMFVYPNFLVRIFQVKCDHYVNLSYLTF